MEAAQFSVSTPETGKGRMGGEGKGDDETRGAGASEEERSDEDQMEQRKQR